MGQALGVEGGAAALGDELHVDHRHAQFLQAIEFAWIRVAGVLRVDQEKIQALPMLMPSCSGSWPVFGM